MNDHHAGREAAGQTALVERVHALTEAIGEAAQIADWQRVARLVEERSPLLMSIGPRQSPAALALIRRIQLMDRALLDDARASRDQLETEYRAAMDRTRSAGQYQRMARF